MSAGEQDLHPVDLSEPPGDVVGRPCRDERRLESALADRLGGDRPDGGDPGFSSETGQTPAQRRRRR